MKREGYSMKKLFVFLMVSLLALLLCSVALAEGELPTEPMTWQYIATLAGATAATLLIVQLLKLPLDKLWKIPTRFWVYIIALALMLAAAGFTTGLDIQTVMLTMVNAVIVALAAMGAYEATFNRNGNG
jgi:hypothetical protein